MAEWIFLPGLIVGPIIFYVLKAKIESSTVEQALQSSVWLRYAKTLLIRFASFWDWFEELENLMYTYPIACQRDICKREQLTRAKRDSTFFEYSPLKPGEIRLLRLHKADKLFPGTIHARLVHEALSAELKYEALSYRWGSSERTDEILVNGRRFPVTKSAFELLLARRSFWHERLVWVDAICINQQDDNEKSVQVILMHDIYSMATRVILFPRPNHDMRLAAGVIYELGLSGTADAGYEGLTLRGLNPPLTPPFNQIAPRWKAVATLLTQEYFCRAWIVQEIVSGSEVQLYLCGHYVAWHTFNVAFARLMKPEILNVLTLERSLAQVPELTLHLMNIVHLGMMRLDPATKGAPVRPQAELLRLESILFMTSRDFLASDPRDRIFAILGIANQNALSNSHNLHRYALRPDYAKPLGIVLLDTTREVCLHQEHCPVDILALAGHGWTDSSLEEPSWVMNLPERPKAGLFTTPITPRPRFKASGQTTAIVREGRHPLEIEVKGVLCDRLLAICAPEQVVAGNFDNLLFSPRPMLAFVDAAINLIEAHQHRVALYSDLAMALLADKPGTRSATETLTRWWATARDFISTLDRNNFTPDERRQYMAEQYPILFSKSGLISFTSDLSMSCSGRRFAITDRGRFALVPPLSEPGDLVWVPLGAQTPYVVRERSSSGDVLMCELMGEAYVQGIMQGEVLGEYEARFMTLF